MNPIPTNHRFIAARSFRRLTATALLGLGLAAVAPTAHAATATVTVDYSKPKQTISGFGAAITWLAGDLNNFSAANQTAILDTLYNVNVPSAGLSIIRTGSHLCEFNPSPGTYNWNNSIIQGEMSWINRVKSTYGVNEVLVSTWTPPAWVKDNNSCSNGGSVLPAHYGDLANTMVTWMQDARTTLGQEVDIWSIQNEPNLSTGYDSCLYTPQQFIDFLTGYLKPAMTSAGLSSKIMLPEPSTYGGASYFDSNWTTPILGNATANAAVDIFATHGYGQTSNLADQSKAVSLYHKPMWMTEISNLNNTYSGTISDALSWANSIWGALNSGGLNAYVWWWAINSSNDNEGLVQYNNSTWTYQVPKRCYALGNFARFIRPGSVVLTSTSTSTNVQVTAVQPASGSVAVVLTNKSKQTVTANVSLAGLGTLPTSVQPYRTSSTENQAALSAIAVSNGAFSITLPAQSITTVVR